MTSQDAHRRSSPRYLVPVLDARGRRILGALLAGWLATVVAFWLWWLRAEHVVTPFGMVVNSAMLIWTMALPAWFFTFTYRMRRPNPELPVPRLRVAMIVTKAPSEPWPVVRRTLEGMLAQAFPYPYDVWLADERHDDPECVAWCVAHGVRVSCRAGVPEYHRPTWPRRTKCKEGNLAYFYDHWGYRDYDVVAQLDADHVPAPGYLANMVRPFADPAVGYVAAPSVCDANGARSWSARGRLFKEATFHGPQQAGSSDGYAPACIGSHYAVRTTALEQAGGLGPELAEDFSTTLILTSCGWRGAFALDAEAHGDGPETFADCVVQESQWSKSLTLVLLEHNPRYWRSLDRRAKLKLGFNQVWYPLYASHMLLASAFPLWALITRTPWSDVRLLDFALHVAPVTLVSYVALGWLRRQGLLRPRTAEIVSWESFLFMFVRWPWVLWGVVQAVSDHVLGRTTSFKVTPKGGDGGRSLPAWSLTPYVALSVGSALAAILTHAAGAAQGYQYFALVNALIYAGITTAIVLLHGHENPRLPTRWLGLPAALAGITLACALVAWATRGDVAVDVMFSGQDAETVRSTVGRALENGAWAGVAAVAFALLAWELRERTTRAVRRLGPATMMVIGTFLVGFCSTSGVMAVSGVA